MQTLTVTYSRVGDLEIKLDIILPPSPTNGTLPGVVHLHGGGMTAGARSSFDLWPWLRDSILSKGIILLSADYRLTHPSTGFDIIADMQALLAFLAAPAFSATHLPAGLALDPSRIAVAGVSGGAYAARAAALYAQPKPRAALLLYGMGGNFLCDHWLAHKGATACFGRTPPVPRHAVAHLLDVPDSPATPVVESALDPDAGFQDARRRIALFAYFWRTGELLDYVLGERVSATLRALPAPERAAAVPARLRPALLETRLDAAFPPTFLVHGDADEIVPLSESRKTYDRLRELGVEAELEVVPGGEHALVAQLNPLEFCPGAAEAHEKGVQFLARHLFDGIGPALL